MSNKMVTEGIEAWKLFYQSYIEKVNEVRNQFGQPLTLAEKILYAHLYGALQSKKLERGVDYTEFKPDRVAMQDATAQMALLQFMNAGRQEVAVPTTVHCDHLILASKGASDDIKAAKEANKEVYKFLHDVSNKYGIGFWHPGAGIIHQVVLENYAFPGGMMVGTDSHTPNAGGLGMIAIGVGGADAVDVMTGMGWELKVPKIIGVKLIGKLNGWASPKDVILKLAGILTTKGGTNSIIEYFGEGTSSISATGKATICNMGAEVGATTSLFPFDDMMVAYLEATNRKNIALAANEAKADLQADTEVYATPNKFYDQIIEINLSELEPHVNGPFTPDAACTISTFAKRVRDEGFPEKMEVALIGSCTNSSYQDLCRAASIAQQAIVKNIIPKAHLIINPGSEKIKATAERDGLLDTFRALGATIMTNACGPCIGQWKRDTDDNTKRNSIVTTFNRNFAKRADGNPNTCAFIVSPEIAIAFALSGNLCFNPLKDSLKDKFGNEVRLNEPQDVALPINGFIESLDGFDAPKNNPEGIIISNTSERLQKLQPFDVWNGHDFVNLKLLIKTKGKCTTDHISMAGPWLKYRGHLENISNNMLMGAVNSFNNETNAVLNVVTNKYDKVSSVAKYYKSKGWGSIVVAEDNYGEGSSREHAAMEPRFLNVRAILAKSFARIHETNLKKQGVLALTFVNKDDYNKIEEGDEISVVGLTTFAPGKQLMVNVLHKDNQNESFMVQHTYNEQQIGWFKAGSALNYISNVKY